MKDTIWISRNDAAAIIGCNPQTISNYIKDGIIKSYKKGRNVYVDRTTLMMIKPDITEIYQLGKEIEQLKARKREELKQLHEKEDDILKALGLIGFSYISKVNKTSYLAIIKVCDLVEREKDVLEMYLNGMHTDEIAEHFDLTCSRVIQIVNKASRKIYAATSRFKKLCEQHDSLMELNSELRTEVEVLKKSIAQNQKMIEENKEAIEEDKAKLLATKIVDLDLSVRTLNCLRAAEIETVGELVSYDKMELLKFRNFGKRSLGELDEFVYDHGLEWGNAKLSYR